jgi:hypothetical protein
MPLVLHYSPTQAQPSFAYIHCADVNSMMSSVVLATQARIVEYV